MPPASRAALAFDCIRTGRIIGAMSGNDVNRTIETVFRLERTRLLGALVRVTRNVDLAEELAQEALAAALTQWPKTGIPDNPAGWLIVAAKRRAIDLYRRRETARAAADTLSQARSQDETARYEDFIAALDDDIGDDRLTLIFTAAHPVLPPDQRSALTLRLVGGLTTAEIARAYFSSEPTIAQRITRAKKRLADAVARYEVPEGAERAERLQTVLEVIYLIFNEGYAATSGQDAIRASLCQEAMRLGRILSGLMPDETEVLGLVALMEIQASRFAARTGPDGSSIPLPAQNRSLWDGVLIEHGLAALARAGAAGKPPGPYRLQAEIAACHARARRFDDTDWPKIASLYGALLVLQPSPVVALNRAVAIGMAEGPDAGFLLLDDEDLASALAAFAPFHAARGDCLERLGRPAEARIAFTLAASMAGNHAERRFLEDRAARCG